MSSSVHPVDLPLEQARALAQRAVDKAEQLGLRGGVAVVGASGALITASRLDRGGAGGMARAVSKAWIAATQQIPSTEHLHRMTTLPQPISTGFVAVSPQARFPGAGGMPVRDEHGVIVGGIAVSGSTVSPFLPTDVAPEVVSADGEPANPEDLLVAYAMRTPYVGQHGDDRARWVERFGDLVVSPQDSLGMKDAPPASQQHELEWARALCDRALELGAARNLLVSVAVVDVSGEAIQQDRADGAVAGGVDVALMTAAAAARFGVPSGNLQTEFGLATPLLHLLDPTPIFASPGGSPLHEDGRVVGAIGVGGAEPLLCAEIAHETAGK